MMEVPVDDRIPYIGIEIIKNETKLETQVYRKSSNTGLLLHFTVILVNAMQTLLKTMLHPTHVLPSTKKALMKNAPNCTPYLAVLITLGV